VVRLGCGKVRFFMNMTTLLAVALIVVTVVLIVVIVAFVCFIRLTASRLIAPLVEALWRR